MCSMVGDQEKGNSLYSDTKDTVATASPENITAAMLKAAEDRDLSQWR